MSTARPPWAWALLSVAVCLVVCWGALGGIPHVTDEVVYTLQARIFAGGARTAPPADVPSMLAYPFWITEPQSRAAFPFGWPLLLALGELLRVPWLVNPLLMGGVVVLTWAVGRRLVDDGAARLAAAIVAVSPALVLLGASRMSHTGVLFGLMLGAWAALRAGGSKGWLLGGLGVAYVVLARPFDALVVGGPLLCLGTFGLLRRRQGGRLALWLVPSALAAGAVLIDNSVMQGALTQFPADAFYAAWTPERPGCNRLGFGPDVGCVAIDGAFGHTFVDALGQALDRGVLLDRLFLGVPLMGALGLWWGRRRPVLLLPLVLVAAGHLLYWSPGLAYGPRFWAIGIPGLAVAFAAGLPAAARRWAPIGAVVASAVGLAWVWPDLSDRYWCVDNRLSRYADQLSSDGGVLFVAGEGARPTGWPRLGVEQFQCDPMLEFGDALVLWDPLDETWQPRHALADPSQTELYRRRFAPGRPAWRVVHDVVADEREVVPLP